MAIRFLLVFILAAMLTGCQQDGSGGPANPQSLEKPRIRETITPPALRPPDVRAKPNKPSPQASLPPGWAPRGPARPWKYIVIHHSATPVGGARRIDGWHRDKGWDELGYHFVVGNGTDTADGQIEVGGRWGKQKWGAHAKTADNRYNDYGIGICIVGNFDLRRPSPQQTRQAAKLVAYLMKTYRIPAANVIGHRDTKPTECPGKYMNLADLKRTAVQMLADKNDPPITDPGFASSAELLHDTTH